MIVCIIAKKFGRVWNDQNSCECNLTFLLSNIRGRWYFHSFVFTIKKNKIIRMNERYLLKKNLLINLFFPTTELTSQTNKYELVSHFYNLYTKKKIMK